MSYKIVSQIHLLPKHQRDFFAGAPVTRMIGQHNIIELGEIKVSADFLRANAGALRPLLSRGEVLLQDESGAPFDLESLDGPTEPEPEPEPEPEIQDDPGDAGEGDETAPEGASEPPEDETPSETEKEPEAAPERPRRKRKKRSR